MPCSVVRRKRELRKLIMERYGGRCVRCGFDDTRILHIDHVNNDGSSHRKQRGPIGWLRDVLLDETGRFQLLCPNCHAVKTLAEHSLEEV